MNPDVVVVGAGFAGLSAAVRLTMSGRRVLVLEGRARLGGRATAFADVVTGEIVDNGQHVLLGCYTETLAFLHDIGAMANVRVQPQLSVAMIDRAGRYSRLVCPPLAGAVTSPRRRDRMGRARLEGSSVVAAHGDSAEACSRSESPGGLTGGDGRKLAGSPRPDRTAARDVVAAAGARRAQSARRPRGRLVVCAGARRDVHRRRTRGRDCPSDATPGRDVRRAGARPDPGAGWRGSNRRDGHDCAVRRTRYWCRGRRRTLGAASG